MRWKKAMLLGAATALLAAVPEARADWDTDPLGQDVVTSQQYLCGANDLPEGPIQGHVPAADQESGRAEQGYNCGLELLGHTTLDLDGRPNNNANMAWAGRCAYVSGSLGAAVAPQSSPRPPAGAGVAVVSVSRRGVPTHVANIRSPGALTTSETLHAVTTPEGRSILVVGQYGNDVASGPKPMDIYDISSRDCTQFRRIPNPDFPDDPTKATFYWPANIHNLTISADGNYVFGTIPLQAIDISGVWDDDPSTGIEYLGNIEQVMDGPPVAPGPVADVDDVLPAEVRSQTHPTNTSHEAWPSPDGRTLYVGATTAQYELLSILDLSDWLDRDENNNPAGPPRVISQETGRGHSVRTATIGGVPYLLHAEESVFGTGFGCIPETANPFAGPAQPWLTDISDPTDPRAVSQFGLEINDPANCGEQLEANSNASVHYHDVDDPDDTTFVMASMWNAGVRVFDVRDPANPTEVAYFNPGDVDPSDRTNLDHAWGHVRYVPRNNQIWFATADGGFWVVRMERQVVRHLGLHRRGGSVKAWPLAPGPDAGSPGTTGVSLPTITASTDDSGAWYCTLAPTTAAVTNATG